jgi:hypothetical protein
MTPLSPEADKLEEHVDRHVSLRDALSETLARFTKGEATREEAEAAVSRSASGFVPTRRRHMTCLGSLDHRLLETRLS